MSSPTALPPTAVAQLGRPATAPAGRFLTPALARSALLLTAVLAAVTAAEPLTRLPWPVPVGAATLGWAALTGLTTLGHRVAARAGPAVATRLVLASFGTLVACWATGLTLAPGLDPADRTLAQLVSAAILSYAAVVTTGLVTGAEATLLRWCTPMVALATVVLAGPPVVALLTPPATVTLPDLPATTPLVVLLALGVPVARAASIACWGLAGPRRGLPRLSSRPGSATARRPPQRGWFEPPSIRHAAAAALLGAGQAAAAVLVWRAGFPSSGGPSPSLLPLLVAVPAGHVWLGWHLARVAAGRLRYDDPAAYQRYLRRLGRQSLLVLPLPLLAAAALALAAHRLPYRLSSHPDPPAVLLSIACGLLLAGVLMLGCLLASSGCPGLAAGVTWAPVLGIGALALGGLPGGAPELTGGAPVALDPPLAVTAIGLAIGYGAGLAVAAQLLLTKKGLR